MADNNIHRANKRGMVLAIDMGNTNIVIGCIDDDKVYFEERLATDLKKTELEYVVLIKTVLELYGIDSSQISGAIISSVVPQLVNIIREAVEKLIDITPMVVGPGVKTGLNIHMDEPRRVGSDLIVDAVAAIKEYGAPVMIIDMGTATTISIVDDKGSYVGGVILPGIRVSVDALASRTAQLPRISLEAPGHVIGKNTLDCMKSGVVYGNASCIDGMIDRMADEDTDRAMYHYAQSYLAGEGYHQYEISNFAMPSMESIHNLSYWECKEYIGFGVAAASNKGDLRCRNTYDIDRYIAGAWQNKEDIEHLTERDRMSEFVFLGLRMTSAGVDTEEFKKRFAVSFDEVFGDVTAGYIEKGLLSMNDGRLTLTPHGIDVSNVIMADYIL